MIITKGIYTDIILGKANNILETDISKSLYYNGKKVGQVELYNKELLYCDLTITDEVVLKDESFIIVPRNYTIQDGMLIEIFDFEIQMITPCFQPNVITERNLNANRFGIL